MQGEFTKILPCFIMFLYLGVAQLVARSVRDAEVDGSSPFTQTILSKSKIGKNHDRQEKSQRNLQEIKKN